MFFEREDWEGVASPRRLKSHKAFEMTIERVLGERIRADGALAVDLWSALANIEWHGPDDTVVRYSFRSAGDLIAWVREDGCYLDWYCSGPAEVVAPWISDALATEGWIWTPDRAQQADDPIKAFLTRPLIFPLRLSDAIVLEVGDADRHAAGWIAGNILETKRAEEGANAVIERMGQHAEATDIPGDTQEPLQGGAGVKIQEPVETSHHLNFVAQFVAHFEKGPSLVNFTPAKHLFSVEMLMNALGLEPRTR